MSSLERSGKSPYSPRKESGEVDSTVNYISVNPRQQEWHRYMNVDKGMQEPVNNLLIDVRGGQAYPYHHASNLFVELLQVESISQ